MTLSVSRSTHGARVEDQLFLQSSRQKYAVGTSQRYRQYPPSSVHWRLDGGLDAPPQNASGTLCEAGADVRVHDDTLDSHTRFETLATHAIGRVASHPTHVP
jgi:hypothetical protein